MTINALLDCRYPVIITKVPKNAKGHILAVTVDYETYEFVKSGWDLTKELIEINLKATKEHSPIHASIFYI